MVGCTQGRATVQMVMGLADIILFGAGASYGAGDVVPDNPPLGNSLFRVLAQQFPGSWGGLPPEVKDAFQNHFEKGMELLFERHSAAIPMLMQHLTLYLAQFRPSDNGNCLYSKLAKWIKSQDKSNDVIISTLNYECLIELAFRVEGLKISYFGEAIERGFVNIWKLHGSCNFILTSINVTRGVSFTGGISFGGELRAVNPADAIEYCLSNTALYPAMALYMSPKIVQITPEQIAQIQKIWSQKVANAERVLVVGVHPYVSDTHIWEPLGQTDARIGYIGSEGAFNDWVSKHRLDKPAIFLGSDWRESFDSSLSFLN